MSDTVFDKIVRTEIPSWKVWEDNDHLAFLTPFANTPGQTIVIPKKHVGDYIFSLEDETYTNFLNAIKTVSKILEKAFNTPRVAMVFEGTGVAYVHAKLYPLHGDLASQTNLEGSRHEFYPEYVGYITTVEGPKMDDAQLRELQKKILSVQ